MTYREAIDELNNKYDADFSLGIRVFMCYCRDKNILEIPSKGFFDKGGVFDLFLGEAAEQKIIDSGLNDYRKALFNTQMAYEMIEKGEKLIREGYRIKDDNSMIAISDVIGERERTHSVSLVGIHDNKKGLTNE